VSADELYDLQRVRESRARSLRLSVPDGLDASRLQDLLAPWRSAESGVPVELRLSGARFSCLLRLGEDWRVRMDETLIADARQWLSHDNVEIHYG
jgi:DNA polymerase-3 subunit alpha